MNKTYCIMIFSLEDYSRYLNGEEGAQESFTEFTDLTEEEFNLLVKLVESTEEYDWR